MDEIKQRVLAEAERFDKALPGLLAEYRGRWVIFLDGEVQGAFKTAEKAYSAAVIKFGLDRGFVVAHVEPSEGPVAVSAGLFFGAEST